MESLIRNLFSRSIAMQRVHGKIIKLGLLKGSFAISSTQYYLAYTSGKGDQNLIVTKNSSVPNCKVLIEIYIGPCSYFPDATYYTVFKKLYRSVINDDFRSHDF